MSRSNQKITAKKATKILRKRKQHGIGPLPASLIERERPNFLGCEKFSPLSKGKEFLIINKKDNSSK
ncbi:hypothetical protein [Mastigocoleus testarum]|uniref:Uncharacterized protein n=1 Tax=Mastigocoleus testarum BC008 TaxID=371196 RepID=A0A0V7ZGR1_9CYAN|nr:hypothetical protein [Mastigocoleus testarum]KST63532.1 hypothetical protein BC008_13795 [Mastigocoleus testarum BC008]